jgi:hypothetical protein
MRCAAALGTTQHNNTFEQSPIPTRDIFSLCFSFPRAVKKKWGSLMPNNYAGHPAAGFRNQNACMQTQGNPKPN